MEHPVRAPLRPCAAGALAIAARDDDAETREVSMNASNGQQRSRIAPATRPLARFPLALLVALSACGGISVAPPDGGSSAGGHTGAGGAPADGGGVCNVLCLTGRSCCGGACVNEQNDPMNCGQCGKGCAGATPLCSGGQCIAPPCDSPPGPCALNALCCGSSCCGPGQLCCQVDGPVSGGPPSCYTPTADQTTCPQGCAPLCVSDRNQKKNITPADTDEVLRRVSRLPIALWTYRAEPDGVRHLGPMAQDFRASFGLGDDDRTYNSVDAHGVALAAIQALDRMVADQQQRIEKLERENRDLARRLRALDWRRGER
jgi:hypothetical protein